MSLILHFVSSMNRVLQSFERLIRVLFYSCNHVAHAMCSAQQSATTLKPLNGTRWAIIASLKYIAAVRKLLVLAVMWITILIILEMEEQDVASPLDCSTTYPINGGLSPKPSGSVSPTTSRHLSLDMCSSPNGSKQALNRGAPTKS